MIDPTTEQVIQLRDENWRLRAEIVELQCRANFIALQRNMLWQRLEQAERRVGELEGEKK